MEPGAKGKRNRGRRRGLAALPQGRARAGPREEGTGPGPPRTTAPGEPRAATGRDIGATGCDIGVTGCDIGVTGCDIGVTAPRQRRDSSPGGGRAGPRARCHRHHADDLLLLGHSSAALRLLECPQPHRDGALGAGDRAAVRALRGREDGQGRAAAAGAAGPAPQPQPGGPDRATGGGQRPRAGQVVLVPRGPDAVPCGAGGAGLYGDAGCHVLQRLDLPGGHRRLHPGLLHGVPPAGPGLELPRGGGTHVPPPAPLSGIVAVTSAGSVSVPVLCGTRNPKDLLAALRAGPALGTGSPMASTHHAATGLSWWLSPSSQGPLCGW